MAKPPATPPSSDIDGVDEDLQRVKEAKTSDRKQSEQLEREENEAHARPRPSRN